MSASESGSETETSMEEKPESETEQGSEEEEEEDDHESGTEQPKGDEQSEQDEEDDSEEEEDDVAEEPEKQEVRPVRSKPTTQAMPKPGPAVQKKPAVGPSAALTSTKVSHPPYPIMVLDAMKELVTDERRIAGVTLAKITKYVEIKTKQPGAHVKLYCWKAIEKHIKDDILMKKTGVGMQGSIGYSAKYRAKLKKDANPKPPKKDKAKAKTAPKKKSEKPTQATKADPKKKPASKAKPVKKDSNNNAKPAKPKTAAGTKKAIVSKTTGKVRLSVGGAAMAAKPKKTAPKAKPAPGAKKEEPTKKPAAAAKTKAPAPEVSGPSKKAKKLMF
uniref:Putative histone h1 n=1 Tax=Culex tarsalis TaxID=7177 RepID=A0A1Q3EV46_CULTA